MSAPAGEARNPARWRAWARRIDALTVRERVIMFVSFAVALVAAADFLALSPRAAEQKALGRALRAQATELDTLRRQLQPAAQGAGSVETPLARLQGELQQAQQELAQADQEIARRTQAQPAATRLPEVMEQVLRRHPRLVLQKLASGAPVATRAGGLPLESLDLVLTGSYPDLTQYVAELEQALPGLRWLTLAVVRGEAGAELQARVALPGGPR